MQVMQDRQADAMFLVRASDLRTFANALIQETGDSPIRHYIGGRKKSV